MKKYIGTKMIEAEPMTRKEYNERNGYSNPLNEDEKGYLVKYQDGYISWSPAENFDSCYRDYKHLSFGHAIEMLKAGEKVARKGWNGKGMFLYYVPAACYPPSTQIAKDAFNGEDVPYGAYIAMKTAQGNVVPWLASQTDMFAEDWTVVD